MATSSYTELHPEDLLERDARGELSPVERERLDAHLTRCAACRLERVVRVDFLREDEEVATHSPADVQRLLAGVLDAPRVAEPRPVAARVRRQRFAGLLLTGVLVTVAGWAAAAHWSGARAGMSMDMGAAPSSARVAAPGLSGAARGENATVVTRDVLEEQVAPPLVPAPSESRPRPIPGARPASIPVATAQPDSESPGLAFQQANEARRAGQHGRAAEGYRALIATYPGSAEAPASLVALGRMLLDDGDAAGALRCFDDYLHRGGGGLGEDVMLGRALALQRLGRSDDESGAWSTLLASYPRSVHAERARRRLLDLGKM
jgi:TolA-binding protein